MLVLLHVYEAISSELEKIKTDAVNVEPHVLMSTLVLALGVYE